MPASKRYETNRQDLPRNHATCLILFYQGQLLHLELAADRDQHDAPRLDLLYQRWWYVARGRGHDNGVEWPLL